MIKLGCIADDFTGATDLANNLVREGMRVVQTIGVPKAPVQDVDAVVIALKSRTAPVRQAVDQSIAAARWLLDQGAGQLYFKVCSTFDSTPTGNIGPVAQALRQLVSADVVPVTPAFPATGRTVFNGHLFVGQALLSDSSMRHHPLTPMTDANLVRVLDAQLDADLPGQVGLVDHSIVASGAARIGQALAELHERATPFAIVDAITDDDLRNLALACRQLPLVVAGSGLAIGMPAIWGLKPNPQASQLPAPRGSRAIVSGSCSATTNLQVAHFISEGGASFGVDLMQHGKVDLVQDALAWALPRLPAGPVLVYATAEPEAVRRVQSQFGAALAGSLVEDILARIAVGLVDAGVGQLVVAGGETSGACVQALGVEQMRIGPQISPGVPWCEVAGRDLHVALKSGNFGQPDFFQRAFVHPGR